MLLLCVAAVEYLETVGVYVAYLLGIISEENSITHWSFSLSDYASLPVLLCAVLYFEFFRKLEIKNEKLSAIICRISPLCLGVYLIHSSTFSYSVLWTRIFHIEKYYDSPFLWIYFLFFVGSIFVAGCTVEYIRQLLFNKLNSKIGMWIENKVITIKDRIISVCSKYAASSVESE